MPSKAFSGLKESLSLSKVNNDGLALITFPDYSLLPKNSQPDIRGARLRIGRR